MPRQQRYYENFGPKNPYTNNSKYPNMFGAQNTYSYGPQNPYLQDLAGKEALANQELNNNSLAIRNDAANPLFDGLLNFVRSRKNRYDERGIFKGEGYLTDFFNNYGRYKPQQTENKSNGPALSGVTADQANSNSVGDIKNGAAEGTIAPAPSPKEMMSVINHQAYLDKYRNSVSGNPDTDETAIKNGEEVLSKAGDGIDFDNMGKATLYNQASEMLKANGLTDFQRGQVLSRHFDKLYADKQNQFNQRRATDLVSQAREHLRNGRYDQADDMVFDIMPYSPAMANLVAGYSNAARNRQMQQQLMALRTAGIGGVGGRTRSTKSPSDGTTTLRTPLGGNPWIGMYETDKDGRLVPKKFTLGGSDYEKQVSYLKEVLANADGKYSPEEVAKAKEKLNDVINSGPARTFTITNPAEQLSAMKFIDGMPLTAKGKLAYAMEHGVNAGPMFRVFADRLGWVSPNVSDPTVPNDDMSGWENAITEQGRIRGPLGDDTPVFGGANGDNLTWDQKMKIPLGVDSDELSVEQLLKLYSGKGL